MKSPQRLFVYGERNSVAHTCKTVEFLWCILRQLGSLRILKTEFKFVHYLLDTMIMRDYYYRLCMVLTVNWHRV